MLKHNWKRECCNVSRYKRMHKLIIYLFVTDGFLISSQAEFVWHKLSADNMDPDFVERRRVGLENFLLRVASHPVLSDDKIFYSFLTEVSRSVPHENNKKNIFIYNY